VSARTARATHRNPVSKNQKKKKKLEHGMVAYIFNPRLERQRQEDVCDFEVSLVYRVSSRPIRVTQ
jgi:hypothetical protein